MRIESTKATEQSAESAGIAVRTEAKGGGPGLVLQHSEAGVKVRTETKAGGLKWNHSEAGVAIRRSHA